MIQKITCFCDNTFSADIPEEVNLDADSKRLDEILNGTFLNFVCPGCGKKHKPEFYMKIVWPSKKTEFEVFSELNRGEFYRRKKEVPGSALKKEVVIGYPELAERLLVHKDNLEPIAIEAIKYFLYLKAEEKYPDQELNIWYIGITKEKTIEFHIHGIREDEVAVMKVPFSLYEKYSGDFKKNPKSEMFNALRVRSYISVKNTMRPEELK